MAASRRCEVVIVGAGLSGLSAAKLLHEQGIDVVVLEAEDRVGGRLHTARNPSAKYVDLGGAYIGPTQNRVFRMLKEYGLKSYKVYEDGDHLVYYNGRTKRLSDSYLALGGGSHFMDVNNMYQLLDKCIEEVPADRPWDAPKALEWDQMTLQAWMDKVMYTRGGAYEEGKMVCRLNYTAEPTDVSFLWILWYTKLAGGILRINSTEGGAQERKVVGGTQQMPENIAASLSDRVYLKQPVRQLNNFSDGVTVKSQDMTVEADYVILATPPALQRNIEFSPPLPTLRNQLIQRVPMGSAIKVMVYYKQAYWREKGFSGMAYCLDDFKENPVCCALDDTKPDGSFPCLVGFVTADSALFMSQKSKEERLRTVAKQYSRMFQCKELLQPVHYEDKDWGAEQWTAGCYTGVMGPGTLTTCGSALRQPIGRMYLAGTETATEWTGYMEGAIQAGERAAREILCKMGKIPSHEIWQSEPESKECPSVPLTRSFVERNTPSVPGLMKLLAGAAVVGAGGLVLKSKM